MDLICRSCRRGNCEACSDPNCCCSHDDAEAARARATQPNSVV